MAPLSDGQRGIFTAAKFSDQNLKCSPGPLVFVHMFHRRIHGGSIALILRRIFGYECIQLLADSDWLRYFPMPRDAVDYVMETFPIIKRKDEAKYGSYRTKETILSIYDEMAVAIAANEAAVAAGKPPTAAYKTRLNPPPGPPADEQGNILPLPTWLPGQPRPADWPPHIHAPREVHEWAIANGIDWRELLDGPPGVLPKARRNPDHAF